MITCRGHRQVVQKMETRASNNITLVTATASSIYLTAVYNNLSCCNKAGNSACFYTIKVLFFHLPGNSVDVKFDHVLPTGVVFWFSSSVLRVDDAVKHTHTRITVNPSV